MPTDLPPLSIYYGTGACCPMATTCSGLTTNRSCSTARRQVARPAPRRRLRRITGALEVIDLVTGAGPADQALVLRLKNERFARTAEGSACRCALRPPGPGVNPAAARSCSSCCPVRIEVQHFRAPSVASQDIGPGTLSKRDPPAADSSHPAVQCPIPGTNEG